MLNYSIEVMFDMRDKWKTINDALDALGSNNEREAFEALRWWVIRLVNDAELCRREEGYDPQPMLTEKDITPRMRPIEYEQLRSAVVDAITIGYGREVDTDEEEVDLGLAELNAKKEPAGE